MAILLQPADWGMRWANPPRHQSHPAPYAVVHQVAGRDPADTDVVWDDDARRAFFNLNEYAIDGKRYSAVDYSMLTHSAPDGIVTNGVARGPWRPAATLDFNEVSKAYCLFGYFDPPNPKVPWTAEASRPPTDNEIVAIAEAIRYGIDQGWHRAKPIIIGHRDNPRHPNATSCPGQFLYARLDDIRDLVYSGSGFQPIPTPTPPNQPPFVFDWPTLIKEDEMRVISIDNYAKFQTDGHTKTWLPTGGSVDQARALIQLAGGNTAVQDFDSTDPVERDLFIALGPIVGPRPADGSANKWDAWGVPIR